MTKKTDDGEKTWQQLLSFIAGIITLLVYVRKYIMMVYHAITRFWIKIIGPDIVQCIVRDNRITFYYKDFSEVSYSVDKIINRTVSIESIFRKVHHIFAKNKLVADFELGGQTFVVFQSGKIIMVN